MNLILRLNGYPSSIILEEDRLHYIDSLEQAWENGDLSMLIELMIVSISAQIGDIELLNQVVERDFAD